MRVKINAECKLQHLPAMLARVSFLLLKESVIRRHGNTVIIEGDTYPEICRLAVVGAVYELAAAAGEDCIALQIDDHHSALIGPAAKQWGDFKPELFVNIPAKHYKPIHGGYPM